MILLGAASRTCRNFSTRRLIGSLLLESYGSRSRLYMTVTWFTLIGILAMDMVWLQFSRLSFAGANWETIIRLVSCTSIGLGLCGLIAYRLRDATDRIGVALREGARRAELYASATLVFGLLVAGIMTYCYLGAAADLVLQDDRLAQIDKSMGFDWVGFVKFTNNSQ